MEEVAFLVSMIPLFAEADMITVSIHCIVLQAALISSLRTELYYLFPVLA